jgi:hypothetical protein
VTGGQMTWFFTRDETWKAWQENLHIISIGIWCLAMKKNTPSDTWIQIFTIHSVSFISVFLVYILLKTKFYVKTCEKFSDCWAFRHRWKTPEWLRTKLSFRCAIF